MYRFLTNDCGCYISGYETMTVWHMRDLCATKRMKIHCNDVKHIVIPQFDGLAIEDLLAYASNYPEVMRALPVTQKEIRKLPRQYIGNIIHTIVGEPFKKWVHDRVEARNLKVAEEGDMMIELDPEIAEIYRASNAVSGKCSSDRQTQPQLVLLKELTSQSFLTSLLSDT